MGCSGVTGHDLVRPIQPLLGWHRHRAEKRRLTLTEVDHNESDLGEVARELCEWSQISRYHPRRQVFPQSLFLVRLP